MDSLTAQYITNLNKQSIRACVALSALLMASTAQADLVAGKAEVYDRFGWALALGDFTNNGLMDLAVGVPGEDIGGTSGPSGDNEGAVNVFYSYSLVDNDHLLNGDHPGFSAPTPKAALGTAVAVGDFNADGFDDLAVGLPGVYVQGQEGSGVVYVYYGSTDGDGFQNEYSKKDMYWQGRTRYSSDPIKGVPEKGDSWGSVLATGLFNNDDYYDLAIGAPGEEVDGVNNAGAVSILYGSELGLTTEGNQMWHQNTPYVEGESEFYDRFGSSLATGDFDGNGLDDLAIGVPYEGISSVNAGNAGAVNVLYSIGSGLAVYDDEIWHQEKPGIMGTSESEDLFGWALAAGDFDNNGKDDLAIGVPGENSNAGVINVIYGKDGGLSAVRNKIWGQGEPHIEGSPEPGDSYGRSLAVGYFNWDNFADLAIGVPHESVDAPTGPHGAVNIMYGSDLGLAAAGDRVFTQNDPGIPLSANNDGGYFGWALAAGDMNGDGTDELAIGLPAESSLGQDWSGAVNVLTGNNNGLNSSYVLLYQD